MSLELCLVLYRELAFYEYCVSFCQCNGACKKFTQVWLGMIFCNWNCSSSDKSVSPVRCCWHSSTTFIVPPPWCVSFCQRMLNFVKFQALTIFFVEYLSWNIEFCQKCQKKMSIMGGGFYVVYFFKLFYNVFLSVMS